MKFKLRDEATGKSLCGSCDNGGNGLVINIDGYEDFSGGGPVMIDLFDDKLQVLVWGDKTSEDPTNRIDLAGAKVPKKVQHEATLFVDKDKVDFLERACRVHRNTSDIGKGETVFDEEVEFSDGRMMAIQVIGPLEGDEPCWTQGVLYEKNGGCWHEIACTDVGESLLGEYHLSYSNTEYTVEVKVKK